MGAGSIVIRDVLNCALVYDSSACMGEAMCPGGKQLALVGVIVPVVCDRGRGDFPYAEPARRRSLLRFTQS